jgi:hypothetical protein
MPELHRHVGLLRGHTGAAHTHIGTSVLYEPTGIDARTLIPDRTYPTS